MLENRKNREVLPMNILLDPIIKFFSEAHWIDITAVFTGIVYVILAARNHIACWFFGIISSALAMYSVFFMYNLYIETFLQGFYVAAGIWGWISWSKKTDGSLKKITVKPIYWHLIVLILGLALSFLFGWLFQQYTEAAATYLDAFTTVFALISTYMVTQRILENWLYWIVIDFVSIELYWGRGGRFYAILYAVYVVMAIVGYLEWRRLLKKELAASNSASSTSFL